MYVNPEMRLGIKVVGMSYYLITSGQCWWGSHDACSNLGGWLTITEGQRYGTNF